jgi:hypothetical protein
MKLGFTGPVQKNNTTHNNFLQENEEHTVLIIKNNRTEYCSVKRMTFQFPAT